MLGARDFVPNVEPQSAAELGEHRAAIDRVEPSGVGQRFSRDECILARAAGALPSGRGVGRGAHGGSGTGAEPLKSCSASSGVLPHPRASCPAVHKAGQP